MTTELRRYQIKPGAMEAFLELWRDRASLREVHGFHVLFGFVDESSNQFTWAFRNDDDPEAAQERFSKDPRRQDLLAISRYVEGAHNSIVRVQPVPSESS